MTDPSNPPELVERIARALFQSDSETFPPRVRYPWDDATSEVQENYTRRARAAIVAIRAYMDEKHGHADRYFRAAFDNECDEALK